MNIRFKSYRPDDFEAFDHCLVQLQDFLVQIDPLKRLRKGPHFSPSYAASILEKVEKYDGAIFLAYDGEAMVGCIAGILEKQSDKNLLECIPTKAGRIAELFVLDAYRNLGIGKQLMEKMESYMRKKKCDVIRVEVFEPNKAAHHFYKNLDYQDRVMDMIKLLN